MKQRPPGLLHCASLHRSAKCGGRTSNGGRTFRYLVIRVSLPPQAFFNLSLPLRILHSCALTKRGSVSALLGLHRLRLRLLYIATPYGC